MEFIRQSFLRSTRLFIDVLMPANVLKNQREQWHQQQHIGLNDKQNYAICIDQKIGSNSWILLVLEVVAVVISMVVEIVSKWTVLATDGI